MRFPRMILLSLLSVLIFLPLPAAQAHAELVASNPSVGAQLAKLPYSVDVTFDGNLLTIGGPKTNVLMVKDSQGHQIDARNSRVLGAKLSVDLNPVKTTGEFTVSWRVVSDDGHPVENSYTFSVGETVSKVLPISPTLTSRTTTKSLQITDSKDFWQRHGTELLLLLAGALSVGIWFRFQRVRRKLN